MTEAWAVPFGLLQDLIAIGQIRRGEAERILSEEEEVSEFFALLSFK